MLTREQLLYLKLTEECNEVAHLCSKIIQFGIQDFHPDTGVQNAEALHGELNDLHATIEMLNADVGLCYRPDRKAIQDKKCKINKWADISSAMGYTEK